MAISGGDGSIILTTKVDESGLKKGMQQANKFAQMSTNEQRRMAQSLSKVYRQQGMSQSEAQKKAWHDLKNNTVATKDLAKATEDVAKKTEQATKETKEYGDTAKRSGTIAKNTFLAVGKAFLTIGVASAAAVVAMTKQAVSAYADYEQLVGGVETLFKGSAQKVLDYANDAFYTAGISANEYMKQVTSFSASLISSTAGDTEKAADIANMALIDISDNVNKMGSSTESVTLAYQGFAKQQYMLLDNLKLGYGGTKTEMQRLLKDATALTGVKYDINNLADVYSAIHAIQENLGITGTTAKEAEKTISGSANMMKASWQNVLSAIAGGGDLDRAINNLVYSIQKYFQNIVPVVQRSLVGIGQLIEQVAPLLVQNVASALIQAIPSLLNAIYQMIIGLGKGIADGIKALFTGGSGSVTADIQTGMSNIAIEAGNASTGVEELGNATEKAGKQAKKALLPFDELQKLSSDTGSSSGATIETPTVNAGSSGLDSSLISETQNQANGITTVLQEQFKKIAEIATKFWNSEPIQAYVEASKTSLSMFLKFTTKMWDNIKTNSSKTWNNVKDDLKIAGKNLVDLWTNVWKDFNLAVSTWGQPIINSISNLFNSIWQTTIDPYIQLVTGVWADFTGILLELWNEYGQTFLLNIGEFVNNIIGLFQSIYDNVLEPIIKPFLDTMSELWDKHISGMIKSVGEFIMKLVNGALEIYNKFIHPIVTWLLETLKPVFSWLAKSVFASFKTVFGAISDVVSGIFKALGGLVDFIVGVFTGNWKKAWEGIKDFFKGIWDTIWGIIKGVINLIIDGLNTLWGGLYAALASIINGVGGIFKGIGKLFDADWGWEVPTDPPLIPKLARGAVLPPNKPFMAIVGDQKHGTNIEAPLDTIIDAMNIALQQNGGGNQQVNIIAKGDLDSIISLFKFEIEKKDQLAGATI